MNLNYLTWSPYGFATLGYKQKKTNKNKTKKNQTKNKKMKLKKNICDTEGSHLETGITLQYH